MEKSYESEQIFGCLRYNLPELTENLLYFLDNNAKGLDCLQDEEGRERIFYHTNGISVDLTLNEFTGELREICGGLGWVEIDLFSQVTKTKKLENKIKKISEKYRR